MRRRAAYLPTAGLCWLLMGVPIPLAVAEEPFAVTPFIREHPDWHYGGFVDAAYIVDFNFPDNHVFRSRTTTRKVNRFALNMTQAYVRKDVSPGSRWGMEFGMHAGYDANEFAFLVGEPKVGGSDTLKLFSRANLSYLVPVGKGLTVTAGLFDSLLGYESLYAKNNFNYTRSWMADNTTYLMFGINASYPVNDELTATLYVINGYAHLSHPNDQPSYGVQGVWKPTSRVTVDETFYAGPDQSDTALEFWRLYLTSSVEWKGDAVTIALAHVIGTEGIANQPGNPRAFVMGSGLFTKWNVSGPWSLAVRPEFFWDPQGRWTGNQQFVKAVTSTVEYAYPFGWTNTMFRLEHRFDESTGSQGGFFKRGEVSPGIPELTAAQHLLIFSVLWTFDSP